MAKRNIHFPHLHLKTAILAALILFLPLVVIVASSPELNETRSKAASSVGDGGSYPILECNSDKNCEASEKCIQGQCVKSCKFGVNSFNVNTSCGNGGFYRYASYSCYDGFSGKLGNSGEYSHRCYSSDFWKQEAQDKCQGRNSCEKTPPFFLQIRNNNVPYDELNLVWNDANRFGRVEKYIVYQKAGGDTNYSKIAQTSGRISSLMIKPKKGKLYYFSVTSVLSNGKKIVSNEVSIDWYRAGP